MKIGVIGIESIPAGKATIMDPRIETLKEMFKSAKKVYNQVEILTDADKIKESDGILAAESSREDLILADLEFVETRLSRCQDPAEKELLSAFKAQLDKEQFLSGVSLTDDQKKIMAPYGLLTTKPIFLAKDTADSVKLLLEAYTALGYISFFTAGEKDAHAWSLKKGSNAWEAAGCIHTDIQKGFIRAEVLGYGELIADGSYNSARGKTRLENKEYIVQDGDLVNFRFNK